MNFKIISILSVLSCLFAGSAHANWQYDGIYTNDGWYIDDGSRFTISFRGGASVGMGTVNNEIGSLTTEYYFNPADGTVISAAYYDDCVAAGSCGGFVYAGQGDIANVPASKDYAPFSFAYGASVGWTVPNKPQWRLELGWDHINQGEYNATPLFSGDLKLKGGSVQSTVDTDIFSVMAFYDFFDGLEKPLREFIPYIGFGIGYADSLTTLHLADLYGDLSTSVDLQNFGVIDSYGVLQFYPSETTNSNVAGLLSLGLSYGIDKNLFIDFGARLTYIPKIKWALSNEDASRQRDWFSASSVIYANIMLGIRYEF